MTSEEILKGESKNTEFKLSLPSNSEHYLKDIIAFANSQGGKLIIGVEDKTRKIIGVDTDSLFAIMDSIANAVSDTVEPQLVPDIQPKTINGKDLIIVTVSPESNRPYYLKSKGAEAGTFIRVSGTSRHASPEKIKELKMEGSHISWDELTAIGYSVTGENVEKLCADIERYRDEAGLAKHKVTETQLINWKLLKKPEGALFASNAFALLTSDDFPFAKTQCAVFKGTDRSVFLDKREFTGPIYEQIEEAVTFVLRNIRLGATIDGLVRKESYELPPEAIREMIVNAQCHRSWTEESCVQVAVYDDRLEVTSPGGLYNGLTLEDILNGRSKLRNRAIANVMNQMGLVEAWGSGIQRIRDAAEAYGLPKPEFQAFDSMFRVNLYRNSGSVKFGKGSEKSSDMFGDTAITETQKKILAIIQNDRHIAAAAIAKALSLSSRAIEKNIRELRQSGTLVRHGSTRGGYWEITTP